MEVRLANALEGLIFGLVFGVIAWFIAFIVRKVSGKNVGSRTYYAVAIIVGFLFRHLSFWGIS